jgi:hypothetical protein
MEWPGVLTLVCMVLKLTDNIDWSWLWVLSPLWILFAAALAIVGLVLTMRGLARAFAGDPSGGPLMNMRAANAVKAIGGLLLFGMVVCSVIVAVMQ